MLRLNLSAQYTLVNDFSDPVCHGTASVVSGSTAPESFPAQLLEDGRPTQQWFYWTRPDSIVVQSLPEVVSVLTTGQEEDE